MKHSKTYIKRTQPKANVLYNVHIMSHERIAVYLNCIYEIVNAIAIDANIGTINKKLLDIK